MSPLSPLQNFSVVMNSNVLQSQGELAAQSKVILPQVIPCSSVKPTINALVVVSSLLFR